eukprot:CAMPEP_0118656630 /NCGR_PEP_ID=MMETSP0785-20121206/13587_1 /TAXON_ID=91992 /ORGANISM="Bolidomonas pacifica, Strain CCMP 1866" /LENGTH=162 /DNA_ID=CAMNT_0006549493 /DNA_START=1 /DNA_END=485 /DNA_ORIENTATION=+
MGAFILHLVGLGILYSGGLYVRELEHSLGISREEASLIPSTFTGSMLFFSLLAGKVMDRYSALSKKEGSSTTWMGPPIMMGGVISFVGLFSLSYIESVVAGFFLSLLVGAGASLFAIPSITIVQSWYGKSSRAKATGIAMAGSGLGNFVYAFFLAKLIDSEG